MKGESESDWLLKTISKIFVEVEHMSPVEFNERYRYLPQSVSRFSGFINYSLTPYWKKILDAFDPRSPVREVVVQKGVQVAATTTLESILFFVASFLKTLPSMYATADLELSAGRIENNFIPMFQQSGMDIFQSADVDNAQKTGKTKKHLQWKGGGYMIPVGARNADKLRQYSIQYLLMDELDAWETSLKRGGNPVYLIKDRCAAYWPVRKIYMCSTPLLKGSSHIEREFSQGDQQHIYVRCLECREFQTLRWSGKNKETGNDYGFKFNLDSGSLNQNSVHYVCKFCGHKHYEHDKPKLFREENFEWRAHEKAKVDGVQSFKIPALYSPAGMQPWYKCVEAYLQGWDVENNRCRDIEALQRFYNNILGDTFEVTGAKVTFVMASSHRRSFYRRGEIPNKEIQKYNDSEILFLTCAVDVHHNNLAVAVFGWTAGSICWLVDYQRIRDDSEGGCESPQSFAWRALADIIENKVYVADDGKRYQIAFTLVDAGYANATVVDFCANYYGDVQAGFLGGVFPIVGRDRASKNQAVKEFGDFKTQRGTTGFKINVDFYKDKLAPILRRDWQPDEGNQAPYTFNAPVDTLDAELHELTREYRREKKLPNGTSYHEWHRPHGAENELWDLLVYSHAAVDIMAVRVCKDYCRQELVDWEFFWSQMKNGIFFQEK